MTASLDNLRAWWDVMKDEPNIVGVDARTLGVLPTEDVLRFIDKTPGLSWPVVGHDRAGKPYYADVIEKVL